MDQPILSVKNVTKVFGTRVAVNNLSFSIREGEIFGFLGPNGAGKSTTMKMICGLSKITKGEIFICGKSITTEKTKALSYVGGFIETPFMYNYLSAFDNLKYFAKLTKGTTKKDIIAYARIVGLEQRLKDKVGTFSQGMKQRLGIAQALLAKPKLLILDEPMNGLDPNGVKEMRDFLKTLAVQQKIGIFISSHMLGEMEQLCDTIAIINNGQLLETKTMGELLQGLEGSKRIRIRVDYPNFAGKIVLNEFKLKVNIAGNSILITTNEEDISKIVQRLLAYNISIFGIEIVSKSLEQIFLEIINQKTKGISWLN